MDKMWNKQDLNGLVKAERKKLIQKFIEISFLLKLHYLFLEP